MCLQVMSSLPAEAMARAAFGGPLSGSCAGGAAGRSAGRRFSEGAPIGAQTWLCTSRAPLQGSGGRLGPARRRTRSALPHGRHSALVLCTQRVRSSITCSRSTQPGCSAWPGRPSSPHYSPHPSDRPGWQPWKSPQPQNSERPPPVDLHYQPSPPPLPPPPRSCCRDVGG